MRRKVIMGGLLLTLVSMALGATVGFCGNLGGGSS